MLLKKLFIFTELIRSLTKKIERLESQYDLLSHLLCIGADTTGTGEDTTDTGADTDTPIVSPPVQFFVSPSPVVSRPVISSLPTTPSRLGHQELPEASEHY